jgi:hypothetical protein
MRSPSCVWYPDQTLTSPRTLMGRKKSATSESMSDSPVRTDVDIKWMCCLKEIVSLDFGDS